MPIDPQAQLRLEIRAELKRLGVDESHPRVVTFLRLAGYTSLDEASHEALAALREKIRSRHPDAPRDLSDQVAACECELKRLGLGKHDFSVLQWLRSNGYERWEALDAAGLYTLTRELRRCDAPGHTRTILEVIEVLLRHLSAGDKQNIITELERLRYRLGGSDATTRP
ncbi:hypothetical protein GS597_09090 [Synechococcales cyanobacterium C]|uniref:Uncharacterized protein n=1 Tax=Petrachloros mirabilis ULC683 TaxID=2781853 RepID=A0A8K1ZYU5_9CYAN|nr:hypothetical protein [Petrachloros mirabilis]NCJ06657.1 hypothetical protein [Petrachloros mirabilis ULC683]